MVKNIYLNWTQTKNKNKKIKKKIEKYFTWAPHTFDEKSTSIAFTFIFHWREYNTFTHTFTHTCTHILYYFIYIMKRSTPVKHIQIYLFFTLFSSFRLVKMCIVQWKEILLSVGFLLVDHKKSFDITICTYCVPISTYRSTHSYLYKIYNNNKYIYKGKVKNVHTLKKRIKENLQKQLKCVLFYYFLSYCV